LNTNTRSAGLSWCFAFKVPALKTDLEHHGGIPLVCRFFPAADLFGAADLLII
jgi:hypothetical protein